MSDKPQKLQEDILDQIISQGLSNIGSPPQEPPQEEAPPGPGKEEEGKAPPQEGKKNRRSAVYIYLVILFGAAFLMLLLAYFVQLRNNEITISDLRDSMNLSRQELLEQVESLELENESLRQDNEVLELEADQASVLYEVEKQKNARLEDSLQQRENSLVAFVALGYLERFCREQDYLMAAAIIEQCDCLFNEHNAEYPEGGVMLPSQAARYLELREEVLDKSGCLGLEKSVTSVARGEYTEQPYMDASGPYDDETLETARSLWMILWYYSLDATPSITDSLTDSLEQLESGPFQPSTVVLFQQIIIYVYATVRVG